MPTSVRTLWQEMRRCLRLMSWAIHEVQAPAAAPRSRSWESHTGYWGYRYGSSGRGAQLVWAAIPAKLGLLTRTLSLLLRWQRRLLRLFERPTRIAQRRCAQVLLSKGWEDGGRLN